MAKTIQIRRNEGPGAKVPAGGQLARGELAIDLVSGNLYVGTGTNPADLPQLLNPAVEPATTTTLGTVIVKDGLNVNVAGEIRTNILTVAGVAPDGTFNVPLTPASVGALPVGGNAVSATRLQTGRNFSITGGGTAAEILFDGTGNVALNLTNVSVGTINSSTWIPADDQILTSNGWVAEADFVLSGGTF